MDVKQVFSLKNNRLIVKEQKLALEFHTCTLEHLVHFRHNDNSLETAEPLIALLVQDSEVDLSKTALKIAKTLYPQTFLDGKIIDNRLIKQNLLLIEQVILKVADFVNYGTSEHSFYRWQVKMQDKLLPLDVEMVVKERLKYREQLRDFLSGTLAQIENPEKKQKLDPLEKSLETLQIETIETSTIDNPINIEPVEPHQITGPISPPVQEKENIASQTIDHKLETKTPKKIIAKKEKDAKHTVNKQATLAGFFSVKKQEIVQVKEDYFKPFFVKANVFLAPINPFFTVAEELSHDEFDLKTHKWRKALFINNRSTPHPLNLKLKLIQFHENYRPAYFGTVIERKIYPKNPFIKLDSLDYEFDSADEWQDEEIGENLSSEDEMEDEEMSEQISEDDDFCVPHGYLSEDEGSDEEYLEESASAKKKGPLVPVIISARDSSDKSLLSKFEFVSFSSFEFSWEIFKPNYSNPVVKKQEFSTAQLEALVNLLQTKKLDGIAKVYQEFKDLGHQISKAQFQLKLTEIAERIKVPGESKLIWQLKKDLIPSSKQVEHKFDYVDLTSTASPFI